MLVSGWGLSDPGRKRERNEDSYLIDPKIGVLAVADGMGGHQGGAVASRMAVDALASELALARGDYELALVRQRDVRATEEMSATTADVTGELFPATETEEMVAPVAGVAVSPALEVMRGVVRRASKAIFEASWQKPELRGMGTTLTAVLIHDDKAHLVHAGDSRCYLFRDGKLRQLSEDHSWIAEQLRNGALTPEEAKASKFRHVITKSIGFERDTDCDLKSVPVSPGDCFLLCSDGMSNHVEHGELERIVAMTWYRKLPETLVALANDRGGDDNITVVVGLVSNA